MNRTIRLAADAIIAALAIALILSIALPALGHEAEHGPEAEHSGLSHSAGSKRSGPAVDSFDTQGQLAERYRITERCAAEDSGWCWQQDVGAEWIAVGDVSAGEAIQIDLFADGRTSVTVLEYGRDGRQFSARTWAIDRLTAEAMADAVASSRWTS